MCQFYWQRELQTGRFVATRIYISRSKFIRSCGLKGGEDCYKGTRGCIISSKCKRRDGTLLVESLGWLFTMIIIIAWVDFLERMHLFADYYYSDARKSDLRFGGNVITSFYTQIMQGRLFLTKYKILKMKNYWKIYQKIHARCKR